MYIRHFHPDLKKILVVGEKCLADEIRKTEIQTVHLNDIELPEREPLPEVIKRVDKEFDSVLMGHDFTFNHSKISYISLTLQRPGVIFLGTNPDKFTTVAGKRQPSNGSIMAIL